jgi:hypothetical protein
MKFLHTIDEGKNRLIRLDEIDTIEPILCIPSTHKCVVVKTKDHEYINLVDVREGMEPRIYINELFKLIAKAPDMSIIRTCNENGDWEMYIE